MTDRRNRDSTYLEAVFAYRETTCDPTVCTRWARAELGALDFFYSRWYRGGMVGSGFRFRGGDVWNAEGGRETDIFARPGWLGFSRALFRINDEFRHQKEPGIQINVDPTLDVKKKGSPLVTPTGGSGLHGVLHAHGNLSEKDIVR